MKIGIFGTGSWGFCLAWLLANKGYETVSWARDPEFADQLSVKRRHPRFPTIIAPDNMNFTSDLALTVYNKDLLVESITSAGLRSFFQDEKILPMPQCPIVITSKGIEQGTGLILPQVLIEVLGEKIRSQIACLSGPSYAEEVIRGLPTSVVAAAYDPSLTLKICDFFSTPAFRVYPNEDIQGVAYGGALKNIIAIACGIAEGLGLGYSTKAAIMTRGLHEIRKLAVASGCKAETLNGLSGMGDLCLTCGSLISRNCRFGYLLAKGRTPEEAQKEIDMVIEGAYTCVSALQLSKQRNIPMPITEMVYQIIYKGMPTSSAVEKLMERSVKAEHL